MFLFPSDIFGLFTKEKPKKSQEVLDVVSSTKTAQTIEEIHHEFATAGDKLLQKANEIISSSIINDEEKVNLLSKHGFRSVKQVTEAQEVKSKKSEQQKIAEAVSDFRVLFPNYKFITEEIVEAICEKYGLVLGGVSLFKGFVPQKNLIEIDKFYEKHPDSKYEYKRYDLSVFNRSTHWDLKAKKEDYEIENTQKISNNPVFDTQQAMMQSMQNMQRVTRVSKSDTSLFICAPLKDMDTTGYELKGRQLVKKQVSFPDPVVMKAELHKNGTKGFIIITAWGDEASDPMVVNEQMN